MPPARPLAAARSSRAAAAPAVWLPPFRRPCPPRLPVPRSIEAISYMLSQPLAGELMARRGSASTKQQQQAAAAAAEDGGGASKL